MASNTNLLLTKTTLTLIGEDMLSIDILYAITEAIQRTGHQLESKL